MYILKGFSQNPPVFLLANFLSRITIVNNAGIVQHNDKVTNGSSTSEVRALQAPCQYLMATALFTLPGLQGSKISSVCVAVERLQYSCAVCHPLRPQM